MDLTGISLDTASVMAGAVMVVSAYGAIWAINKVIGVFKKQYFVNSPNNEKVINEFLIVLLGCLLMIFLSFLWIPH